MQQRQPLFSRRRPAIFVTGALVVLLICLSAAASSGQQTDADNSAAPLSLPARPVALASWEDGRRLIVAGRSPGMLAVIDVNTNSQLASLATETIITDIVSMPSFGRLIAVDATGTELVVCELSEDTLSVAARLPLPRPPGHEHPSALPLGATEHEPSEIARAGGGRKTDSIPGGTKSRERDSSGSPASANHPLHHASLALSPDNHLLAVTSRSGRCITVIPIDVSGVPQTNRAKSVALRSAPQCVLALPAQQFLIADAFGGRLALIDSDTSVIAEHELYGHHIRGLCLNSDSTDVLIAHQILSRVARTTRDDIHWGSLIRNVVTTVSIDALLSTTGPLTTTVQTRPVGDTGNGAADPAAILPWQDGFVVASTGSDRVWVAASGGAAPADIPVGVAPSAISFIAGDRLAVLNSLDATMSVVDLDTREVLTTLGTPSAELTSVERGERAFFSGRLSHDNWMSCSSCHVDAHTPELLSDTLSDGGFGDPKRIPSLYGTAETGPWGWLGNKDTLDEQLHQTLTSTMHGGITDERTIRDLIAYLRTLPAPDAVTMSQESLHPGAAVFETRGCVRCHQPPIFTNDRTWDVGVTDASGNRHFNPPSLRGLRYRSRYFHDARFDSLTDLLHKHPDPAALPLSETDRTSLIDYLQSL